MSPSLDTREQREFAAEIKFLVAPELAEQIRAWARGRLMADPHASGDGHDGYSITSLYFDTGALDVFHRRGSFGRSKYRIRRYGASETAFLERKLRTRGLLAKRRSKIALDALGRLAGTAPEHGWPGFWFHRRARLRQLEPVCQIAYQRTARVALTPNGPIRLTLDDQLRAQPARGLGFHEQPGTLLAADRVILEMKFRREMPILFKYLVAEFALNPQPFSKYRFAMDALDLVPPSVTDAPASGTLHYA